MHVLSKFLSGNECVKEYISFGRLDSSVNRVHLANRDVGT